MRRFGVLISLLLVACDICLALTSCRNRARIRSTPSLSFSIVSTTSDKSAKKEPFASSSLTQLTARRRFRDEPERDHDELSRQRSTDRPTLRQTQVIGPPIMPSKPKIVVLGASGRIGRLVVRQLLEMSHLDATIIACVRHYDKAIKVLYDDLSLASNNNNKKGPRLRIVEADLVPPEELPGYLDADEDEWRERAESAAKFYNTSLKEYDNREESPVIVDSNEALQDAIQDCTTIIFCAGTVRPTNVWTDLLARPLWRLLNSDVSKWCKDGRHPYYVHFASTRKILGWAEREQIRREAAVEAKLEEEEEMRDEPVVVPKIRFIRVSDNCLSQAPWDIVPLLTNIFRSMVFRYHDMAERLLESSTLIDSVILRPGDLVDDERNSETTNLQVDPSGEVPNPAVVNREDVASLAVASALFKSPREKQAGNIWKDHLKQQHDDGNDNENEVTMSPTQSYPPFHCKLGIRWVSDEMDPYPKQGRKRDGHPTAQVSLQRAIKMIEKKEKKEQSLGLKQQQQFSESSLSDSPYPEPVIRLVEKFQLRRQQQRRPIKPYGIVAAIPIYLVLGLLLKSLSRMAWQALCSKAWAQPVVVPLQQIFAMILAMWTTQLRMIFNFLSQRLPRGIGRLFAKKQYISF